MPRSQALSSRGAKKSEPGIEAGRYTVVFRASSSFCSNRRFLSRPKEVSCPRSEGSLTSEGNVNERCSIYSSMV